MDFTSFFKRSGNSQPWRRDPLLAGRFHPHFPDDLEVLVHDGTPAFSGKLPELVWVTVTAATGDTYEGTVLNQPHHLESVRKGDSVQFLIKDKWANPVQVREDYLAECADWHVFGCDKCGFDMPLDAPSVILKKKFNLVVEGDKGAVFTYFCPLCPGKMLARHKNAPQA